MMQSIKQPKNLMVIFLSLLLITASSKMGVSSLVILLIQVLGFTILADIIFNFIKLHKFVISTSAIITGLILTLIIDTQASWYQILVIGALAMASKIFLRPQGRHIFNPAAFGLLFGFLFFGLYPSWWAPSPNDPNLLSISNLPIYIPILLFAYVSCYKLRRYFAALAYLITYFIGFLVIPFIFADTTPETMSSIFRTLLGPGALFYTFVMLCEPMTSPPNRNRQITYGLFIAIFTMFLGWLSVRQEITLPDASLGSLLLGNLIFLRYRQVLMYFKK